MTCVQDDIAESVEGNRGGTTQPHRNRARIGAWSDDEIVLDPILSRVELGIDAWIKLGKRYSAKVPYTDMPFRWIAADIEVRAKRSLIEPLHPGVGCVFKQDRDRLILSSRWKLESKSIPAQADGVLPGSRQEVHFRWQLPFILFEHEGNLARFD